MAPTSSLADPAMERAIARAASRVGRLAVDCRLHRLPRRLEDDYALDAKALGSGRNGKVISAWHRRTGVHAAVKTLPFKGNSSKEIVSEVEALLSLDHPHIVRLLGVYETETEVSLVTECCEGGELYDRVASQSYFPEDMAVRTTQQMLRALKYLHSQNIVHRDVKLENMMYDRPDSDFLKILDFGFSRFYTEDLTMGERLGTVMYVAPEVLSRRYSGNACDLWSLGVLVYIVLMGVFPFSGRSDEAVVQLIYRGLYSTKGRRYGSISGRARDFLKRLLTPSVKERMSVDQALAHPWLKLFSTSKEAVGFASSVPHALAAYSRAPAFQQVCLRTMALNVSPRAHREFRETFLLLDTSLAGAIQPKDLRALLEGYPQARAEELTTLFDETCDFDLEMDEEIGYSQFVAVMLSVSACRHAEAIRETFNAFDRSGCGVLTPDALANVLEDVISADAVEGFFRDTAGDLDDKIGVEDLLVYLKDGTCTPDSSQSPESMGLDIELQSHAFLDGVRVKSGLRSFESGTHAGRTSRLVGCLAGSCFAGFVV